MTFVAFMLTTMAAAENINTDLFPVEVQGWVLSPAAETYSAETLCKYIDGASELYISYGFTRLHTRRYERAGMPEITVDLFDMGDPGNAFGIFAHGQETPGHAVGQDSEYMDGLLRFWQGNYYVSLLCSPETPESQTAVLALGRQIAKRLSPPVDRPKALALLPEKGLVTSSIRYFHHYAWQNTYLFISSENILGIGPGCNAVLAKYEGEPRPIVLLVLYPDREAAERALAGLGSLYGLHEGGGAARLKDEKNVAVAVWNRILAAVWHAGGAVPAEQLLAALRKNIVASEK